MFLLIKIFKVDLFIFIVETKYSQKNIIILDKT